MRHKEVIRFDREKPRIYFEPRDVWVGYFAGDGYHYVCILPCIVIRWPRAHRSYWGDSWARCYCAQGHHHGVAKTLIPFEHRYVDPRESVTEPMDRSTE